jgi:hypothetical protein
MTVGIVEVTPAQKEAAQLLIELSEHEGWPIRDWTRRVAAAQPHPEDADPELDASDEEVLYLV